MNTATGFDRRHPRSVILIRVLVTAWLFGLTGILLADGYWGWALLTLAGAVANSVWAYRVWRAASASPTGRPRAPTLALGRPGQDGTGKRRGNH